MWPRPDVAYVLDGTFLKYYYFITRKNIVDGHHQLVRR